VPPQARQPPSAKTKSSSRCPLTRLLVARAPQRGSKTFQQLQTVDGHTTAQNPNLWGPLGYVQMVTSHRMLAAIKMAITVRRPPTHPTSTKAGNGSMLVDFTVPVWLPKVKCCEQGDFRQNPSLSDGGVSTVTRIPRQTKNRTFLEVHPSRERIESEPFGSWSNIHHSVPDRPDRALPSQSPL
jgi:hypothetical protein